MTTRGTCRMASAVLALTLGLTLLGPTTTARATPAAPVATPRPQLLSPSSRPLDPSALQAALDAVTAGAGVGAVAQVVGPQGTWSSASGVRRLSGQQPVARPGDRVRIASVTKAMVATLAMQEVQRGHWKLSTRVEDVVPGLLPGHGDITLDQLLSHRSGAPDYLNALLADATTVDALLDDLSTRYTDRQLVRAALTLPWSAPGSPFSYSNTNYVIVGMMLAHANHRSVRSLLQRRVFDPAHMTRSTFAGTAKIRGGHLTEYSIFDRPYSLASFEPSVFSSAGAVVSTARDVNRFYAALLKGRLLRRGLVDQMLTPPSVEPLYGFGIYAAEDPCPAADGRPRWLYGHDGASFGTLTLTLSSRRADRQVTVSATGRSFDPATDSPAIDEFAYDALLATCPTAVAPTGYAPSARARGSLPRWSVPWADRAAR